MGVRVIHADCRDAVKTLGDCSVDSVVTDPPYALQTINKRFAKVGRTDKTWTRSAPHQRTAAGFMNQKWDTGETAFDPALWADVLRVLKPGGHLLAFGGTRTYHRLACAIEDAGFEIRDQMQWIYGSGFAKSHNLRNKPVCDCECFTNPVPYDHDKQATEHVLRPVQGPDLSASFHPSNQRREVLFKGLQEQGAQERGIARPQSEAGAAEQSGVEGRPLRGAGQGLRDDLDAGSPQGSEERLCVRTHPGGGEDAWKGAGAGRGSAPREQRPSGQPAGEPEGVRKPSGALDGGTLRGRGVCPRCGNLRKEFEGWGTALKPSHEPIVLARKPLIGTVAANVLEHGTGALNIDGCRIGDFINTTPPGTDRYNAANFEQGYRPSPYGREGEASADRRYTDGGSTNFAATPGPRGGSPEGRWPANVIHDGSDEVLAAFPDTSSGTGAVKRASAAGTRGNALGRESRAAGTPMLCHGDAGSAARFFYSAKADATDRLGSKHPTVKPVDLMAYLCRLITPPGGTVLDPFAGSGTTGMACLREGFDCILVEREAQYVADIHRRLKHVEGSDTPLFAPADEAQQALL